MISSRNLEVVIKSIGGAQNQLKEKHRLEQEFNRAAWAEYGSELCSGEMENNEKKILGEISAIQEMLDILVAVRDHGVDLDKKKAEAERELSSVKHCITFAECRLEQLRQTEKRKEARLARISKALKFIS